MGNIFVVVMVVLGLASGPTTSAREELTELRRQARAANEKGDQQARVQAILKIEKLLNNSPNAIETLAQAYAAAGDSEHAIAALNQYADLGLADDDLLRGHPKPFDTLEKLPEYQSILSRFKENETAVSRGEMAFALPDPNILAEDIDYDPLSKTFLITGVLEKKIIRITAEGKAVDFAQSPSHWPMLGIKVDASRGLVWATEVALDGFTAAPKSDWGRSGLSCYDLRTGALRRRVEGPAHSALGDLVLTPEGEPIVSDGEGGGMYQLKGDSLERIDGGEFISPQTATMHPDGKHVLIPDYLRGVGVLDLASKQVTWLNQGERPHALSGIDGLYFDRGWLIATQNGTSPERVIRFQMNSTLTAIESEEVIERATSTLGDPTHGVVVGDFFYYIANSGWSELDDHGDVKAGSKLTPARVMRVRRR